MSLAAVPYSAIYINSIAVSEFTLSNDISRRI